LPDPLEQLDSGFLPFVHGFWNQEFVSREAKHGQRFPQRFDTLCPKGWPEEPVCQIEIDHWDQIPEEGVYAHAKGGYKDSSSSSAD